MSVACQEVVLRVALARVAALRQSDREVGHDPRSRATGDDPDGRGACFVQRAAPEDVDLAPVVFGQAALVGAAAALLATDMVEAATANTKAAERRRRVTPDMAPPISCG